MAASWRAGLALVIAPVLGLGLLTGCSRGDSLTYAGERVQDPETFLREVEAQWRTDLGDERVTKHQQARCYLSTPEETRDLDGSVFCGPVRYFVDPADQRAGDQNPEVAGPGLWDRYTYRASQGSDGYALTEPRPRTRGADLPGGLELLRPDGQQPPPDGESLTAPPPPPAESGYLDTDAEVDVAKPSKPEDGRIVTPEVTVTVERVGATDRIRTDDGTKGPARGERFVVATLSFDDGPFADTYDDGWGQDALVDADVSYAVQVGDDRRQIDWRDSTPPGTHSQRTIVVSVPRSAEPFLVVSAAGRDQQVSLTTGVRGDAVAGFYGDRSEVGVSRQYAANQFVAGDFQLSYSLLFAQARLTPFDPTRGWAPQGRAWLFVDTEQVGVTWPTYPYSLYLDRAATATVTDDRGTASHDLGKSQAWTTSAADDISPVFEVDADATNFRLTYRPTFTFSAPGGGGYSPTSGSGSLQTLEVDLRF